MSSTEKKNNLYMSCLLKLYGVHHILYFLLPSAGVYINPWISVLFTFGLTYDTVTPQICGNATYLPRLFSLVWAA